MNFKKKDNLFPIVWKNPVYTEKLESDHLKSVYLLKNISRNISYANITFTIVIFVGIVV